MMRSASLVTTVCQYEVLKYLSLAASTLAKCAKIIPVMCWGRLILNKRYSAADFVSAFVVTAGCFIFVLDRGMLADRDRRTSRRGSERQRYYAGMVTEWEATGVGTGTSTASHTSRLRRDERPRGRDARRDGPWRIRRGDVRLARLGRIRLKPSRRTSLSIRCSPAGSCTSWRSAW